MSFILWETAEKPNHSIHAAVSHQFSKNRVAVLPNEVTMSGKMGSSTFVQKGAECLIRSYQLLGQLSGKPPLLFQYFEKALRGNEIFFMDDPTTFL